MTIYFKVSSTERRSMDVDGWTQECFCRLGSTFSRETLAHTVRSIDVKGSAEGHSTREAGRLAHLARVMSVRLTVLPPTKSWPLSALQHKKDMHERI
jgi:hypothetical protein